MINKLAVGMPRINRFYYKRISRENAFELLLAFWFLFAGGTAFVLANSIRCKGLGLDANHTIAAES